MSAIDLLTAQPGVQRLGWTLLHFVWQGLCIGALYAAARRLAYRSRPQVRYVLACAALAAMAAAPVVTWALLHPPEPQSVAASFSAPLAPPAPGLRGVPETFPAGASRELPPPFLSWVVALWLAGAAGFGARMAGGWIGAERLRTCAVCPAPTEWTRTFLSLKTRMRVPRTVRLLISPLIQAPVVVGWLRPAILIPAGALTGLPAEQLEGLLLHELAHIRRHDYLVNLLQGLAETLLFYHPVVWWVSAHIRTEREQCCDDLAVAVTGDALSYAHGLAAIASAAPPRASAMAANSGGLADRIARLLGEPRPCTVNRSGTGAICAALLFAAAGLAIFAQTAPRPKFEVASVRPSSSDAPRSVRPTQGRLTADAPLTLLIQNAYGVQSFQIAGAPGWADSDRFHIEATADGSASRDQIFLMLQSLLEERFQLHVHRESRQMPVYLLTAVKNGPRLPAPRAGACQDLHAGDPLDFAGGRMQPPGPGAPPAPRCGSVRVRLGTSGAVMEGGNVRMPELTRVLSMVMDRTVLDKTGFSQPFDLQLAFLPDQASEALPPPPPDSAAALVPASPSIVTALQEQLGLRIQSGKGPVDVLVVDRVEKPSL